MPAKRPRGAPEASSAMAGTSSRSAGWVGSTGPPPRAGSAPAPASTPAATSASASALSAVDLQRASAALGEVSDVGVGGVFGSRGAGRGTSGGGRRGAAGAGDRAGVDEAEEANVAFVKAYERTWEALEEDEDGRLRVSESALAEARNKRASVLRLRAVANGGSGLGVRRGMVRYVVLVVDLSGAAREHDPSMRPSRLSCVLGAAQALVREFFALNPLGSLCMVALRGGRAWRVSDLSGNPRHHAASLASWLRAHDDLDGGGGGDWGEASVQNAVETSLACLAGVPPYGRREAVLIYAALNSVDPGDASAAVAAAKKAGLRCSVVGLAAEVHILGKLAHETGGTYHTALDSENLFQLVRLHGPPPPDTGGEAKAGAVATVEARKAKDQLIRMGFPRRIAHRRGLCACHGQLRDEASECTQCGARVCDLPATCPVCSLTLVSSPHLARSYHHLFPVPVFEEVPIAMGICRGCLGTLGPPVGEQGSLSGAGGAGATRCPQCLEHFCLECDGYVHAHLHNCPGCESRARVFLTPAPASDNVGMEVT